MIMAHDALAEIQAMIDRVCESRAPGAASRHQFLYLTAEWCEPVDAQVFSTSGLPPREALIIVRRCREKGIQNGNTIGLDPTSFRLLCVDLDISHLPALIAVDNACRRIPPADGVVLMDQMALTPEIVYSNEFDLVQFISKDSGKRRVDDATVVQEREAAVQLYESGDFRGAAIAFMGVLLHCPDCTKSHFNLAIILQMLDEVYFAVHHMLQVVSIDDQDAVAHTVLRTVFFPIEPKLVIDGYKRISANPNHVRAWHSLATLVGDAVTAAPAYVRQVFDDLAETFEEKLVTHLEYRVPWLLTDALSQVGALSSPALPRTPYRAIDLGCGTGLCGRLLRGHVTEMIGVDLSPSMIEKTKCTGFYDSAIVADIIPFLEDQKDESVDLVISADVWIYVGALETIFALVAAKLGRGKWFAFSVELLESPSDSQTFRLAPSGRFQHAETYITRLAAKNDFIVVINDAINVRKESGEPIPGRIFVLQIT